MNDKEFLETLTKEQIIDLYLVMDAGYKNEIKDKAEKLDVVDDIIKYILDGKYQEAIELLLLTFYDGYIPIKCFRSF